MDLITFLDEETTGKMHPDHRIIELSLRVCDLAAQKELENIKLRFNPLRNIDAKAFAVHGITVEELKAEPTIDLCLPAISKILNDSKWVVAHNGISFDFPFLAMEYNRCGLEMPDFQAFDTMVHGNFATDLGKNPTLAELCWSLDVDYDPTQAHAGDYDTRVMRDAFFNGLNYGWFALGA